MKIAIIDDEVSEQELIANYVRQWAVCHGVQIEICQFDSSESFLFDWEDQKDYDLLALDIEMGRMNGLELARKIRKENETIPILFVTGYEEYMQYGYDVDALHYLLKPLNKNKLFRVLDKLQKKTVESPRLFVQTADGMRSIDTKKIMYLEAAGHGSILHLTDEVVQLKDSIGSIEGHTAKHAGFTKCHRAYLVNLRFVAMVLHTELLLDNDERLPVSRNQSKKVQQEFIGYYKTQ